MTDFTTFANLLAELPDLPEDSIVSRTLLKNDHTNVTLFAFAAGQELTEHTATRPAILHFLQGEADVTLGGEHISASANRWVYMPPNLPHSIAAQTSVILLLILLPTA